MLKRYNKLVYLFVRPNNMCVLTIERSAFLHPASTDLFSIVTEYKQNPTAKKQKRNYWIASYFMKTKYNTSEISYGFNLSSSGLASLDKIKYQYLYKEYKKRD